MDYTDYVSSYGLDPTYFTDSSGNPLPSSSSGNSGSNSGFNWGALTNSVVQAGGNVLTQTLKNQALSSQAKLAANQSSSTMTIIIIAVAGLLGVGILFAILGRHK
jgi:hypothetical protein